MSQPRTPIRVSKASMVAVAFTAILSCTAAVAPFMAQAAEGKTIVVAEFRDVSPILVGNDVKLTGVQVGKVADMVVLAEDPLSCDLDRLKDVRVDQTFLGGRQVFGGGLGGKTKKPQPAA